MPPKTLRNSTGDQVRAAGVLDGVRNRDQGRDKDQQRPVQRRIGLAHLQAAQGHDDHRRAEEGDGHGYDAEPDQCHGDGQHHRRQEAFAHTAQPHLALGQRQEVQRLQGGRQALFGALQQDDVAGGQSRGPQMLGQLIAATRHAQQVDAVLAVQVRLAHRLPLQQGVAADDRLDDRDLLAGVLHQDGAIVADQAQLRTAHEFLERLLLALDQKDVAGADHNIAPRVGTALAVADQGHDPDVALAALDQRLDRHRSGRPVLRRADLGGVGVGGQGRVHRRRALPVSGQQPVAEGEEGQGDGGQAQTDRSVVEHAKRLAEDLVANLCDDDVGRGPDQGDHSAGHGPEGHRHQQPRGRRTRPPRHLQGDRHHDGQSPDVLGRHRQQSHRSGQHRHLRAFGFQVRQDSPHGQFDDPGPGEGRRNDQGAGDDDGDVVLEPVEGRVRRDDSDRQTQHQGHHRHQIIAEPPPDKGADGQGDQSERQALLQCHAVSVLEVRRFQPVRGLTVPCRP
jgi:hypothetical protein